MRICITLDDVIRAKTVQYGKIYQKYTNPDVDLEELELTTSDMGKLLGMNDKESFKFLYEDYPFEIFGEANPVDKMLDKNLNLWLLNLSHEHEDVEVVLSNPREFNASIGFTYFFLSKIATRCREVFFPMHSEDIWNKCDVLITADKALLENKPEGKKSVKISMPYNEECTADLTYEKLADLLADNEFIKKIGE